MKMKKPNIIIGVLAVLLVAAVVWGVLASAKGVKAMSPEQAKQVTEDYINTNLMTAGTSATITSVEQEGGLYKMMVDIGGGNVITSYTTLDGNTFFPQGLQINDTAATTDTTTGDSAASQTSVVSNMPQTKKPTVELFVMSHCPYGTQMEKGILPAVEALGNDIDFELKFVDYVMHGDKELNEELNQYCIMQEYPDKINDYLGCFLADGNTASCVNEMGFNQKKLDNCINDTDNEYKVTYNSQNKVNYKGSYPEFAIYKADNTKYGVGGSPTLVINGTKVSPSRDSASLLATICNAFEDQPDACSTQLSSASPSPGFGFNTAASSNSAATCN